MLYKNEYWYDMRDSKAAELIADLIAFDNAHRRMLWIARAKIAYPTAIFIAMVGATLGIWLMYYKHSTGGTLVSVALCVPLVIVGYCKFMVFLCRSRITDKVFQYGRAGRTIQSLDSVEMTALRVALYTDAQDAAALLHQPDAPAAEYSICTVIGNYLVAARSSVNAGIAGTIPFDIGKLQMHQLAAATSVAVRQIIASHAAH